MNLIMQFTIR